MNLLPPQPTESVSSTTGDLYEPLYQIQIPDKELGLLFSVHDTLSLEDLGYEFKQITDRIMQWLEAAHMTAFTIEQNVKRQQQLEDIEPLLLSCQRMAPLIPLLIEMNEIIHDDPTVTITKIQSEWSGLQHFISSVKKALEESNEKNLLLSLMSSILFQIDDLSIMIFQYQEKRHIQAVTEKDDQPQKEDSILIDIDNRVGPLFNDVEKVYNRMTSAPPEDTTGLLIRKHLIVQDRWESLRVEIDELKVELKEDRWLIVFKQVADQVDGMMDGLDKTVSQCYMMIQQIKETGLSASTSSSTSTSTSSNSSGNNTNSVMDKLRSVEKNFDAKYKYYTPSIAKMLTMLGNGIAARVSRNATTLNRHESMLGRWNQLKITMDNLRKKDLPDISTIRPTSPATTVCWSRLSDRSDNSNFLMKSPEPTTAERSRSPYVSSVASSSPIPFNMMDEYHRKTPTTPSKRDHHLWQSSKSPSPVYGRSQQMSPLSREKRSNLVPSTSDTFKKSSVVYKTNIEEDEDDDEFEISTSDFRRQQQQHQQPIATPTFRSKSSLSTSTRSMTPNARRCGTPSMIPRPKTPTASSLIPRPKTPSYRAGSPSFRAGSPRIGGGSGGGGGGGGPRIGSPMIKRSHHQQQQQQQSGKYRPNVKDPLDKEIGFIINSSPVPIQCQKAAGPHEGRYYFGNELTPSLGGGKKIYTCKLMTYDNNRSSSPKSNKVLIRVGGGWQGLDIFLLEHMNLMGG
ncbi:hypothetical protein EDC94DRAFT_572503 [Helicostylum pulchrum]|uniref:GAR domain-containing protein n=1 Tax=Helicostylum pulchrum TaxID=562976 RepID=A0ABP9XMJ3_9FUNG|nr:hypothetical protein EDC94DRAFT_572503 [Helicostylum pulchrum]